MKSTMTYFPAWQEVHCEFEALEQVRLLEQPVMELHVVQASEEDLNLPEGQLQEETSEFTPVPGHWLKVPPEQAVMEQSAQP